MGLLDDLKHQADSVLVQKRASEEDRTKKLQASHARMKAGLQYWVDFFKALNVVKPEIVRNYYIEGSTQLANLVQCDYNVNSRRVSVEHHDYIDSIELRFRCVSSEGVTIEKESDILVNRLREHLWTHGLKFEVREIRKEGSYVERGIFTIAGEVVVRLTFAAHVEDSRISLTVRNFERLGEYTYLYDAEEVGPELLEEIGKAILAQPNRLRTIGRRQSEGLSSWRGPARRASDASTVS